jgi:hypothetical protein
MEDLISFSDGPNFKLPDWEELQEKGGPKTQISLELAYRMRDREPTCLLF